MWITFLFIGGFWVHFISINEPISGYFYQGLDWTGLRVPQKKGSGTAEESVCFSY